MSYESFGGYNTLLDDPNTSFQTSGFRRSYMKQSHPYMASNELLEPYSMADVSSLPTISTDMQSVRIPHQLYPQQSHQPPPQQSHQFQPPQQVEISNPENVPVVVPTIEGYSDFFKGPITELIDTTIVDFIKKQPSMILFYAPWCVHCIHFRPIYDQASILAKEQSVNVQFGYIDGSKYPSMVKQYGIAGFPSVNLFVNEVQTFYDGKRVSSDIVSWISKRVSPPALQDA